MDKIEFGVTEGMNIVSEILTVAWISEMSGLKYDYVRKSINKTMNHGHVVHFKDEHAQLFNDMLSNIVELINNIQLEQETCFDTLKIWSKRIKPVYLVEKQMGKSKRWKLMHFSDSTEVRYYGKFTDKDLLDFKFALREVAAKLASIRLVPDVK